MNNPDYKFVGKKVKAEKQAKTYNIKEEEGKKEQVAKPKGRTQGIIDLLRKNINKINENDPANIRGFLAANQLRINEDDAEFYSKVLLLTFNNIKVNITDILGGRTFTYYIGEIEYNNKSTTFCNDKLFWLFKLFQNTKSEIKELFIDENISLSLQTYSNTISTSYQKGFIQDYNKLFSFFGFSLFNMKETTYATLYASIVNGYETFAKNYSSIATVFGLTAEDFITLNFPINNKKFNSYYIKKLGTFLCFEETMKLDDIIDKMKGTLLIDSKSTTKNSLKVIEISKQYDEMNVFISQKIKLSDFMPGIVEFPVSLTYSYLLKVHIDMALLDEYLWSKYNDEKKTIGDYFFIPFLVNWDTFDLFSNYVTVLLSTRFRIKDTSQMATSFKAYLKFYSENRSTFTNFKKYYSELTSLLLKYYDSFHNRINVDSCESMSKLASKMIRRTDFYRANLRLFTGYAVVLKDYNLDAVMGVCYNSMNALNLLVDAYDSLVTSVKQVIAGTPANLEEQIRSTGQKIYRLLTNKIIDEIRTPSGFLGDLSGADMVSAKMVEEYVKKKLKGEEKDKSDIDKFMLIDKISDDEGYKYGLAGLINIYGGYGDITTKDGSYVPQFITWINSKPDIEEELKKRITIAGKMSDVSKTTNAIDSTYKEYKDKIDALIKLYTNYLEENGLKDALAKLKKSDKILETTVKKDEVSSFTKETTIKSGFIAASKKEKKFDSSKKYLNDDEIITEEAIRILGIPTYQSLIKQDLNENQKKTLNAWRERGVSDDILFQLYIEAVKTDPKLIIPALTNYVEFLKSMQSATMSKYGNLKESLKEGKK